MDVVGRCPVESWWLARRGMARCFGCWTVDVGHKTTRTKSFHEERRLISTRQSSVSSKLDWKVDLFLLLSTTQPGMVTYGGMQCLGGKSWRRQGCTWCNDMHTCFACRQESKLAPFVCHSPTTFLNDGTNIHCKGRSATWTLPNGEEARFASMLFLVALFLLCLFVSCS